jgi:hypothetical protein
MKTFFFLSEVTSTKCFGRNIIKFGIGALCLTVAGRHTLGHFHVKLNHNSLDETETTSICKLSIA